MSRLRAVFLAAVYLGLFALATPGIDSLGSRLNKQARQEALDEGVPKFVLDGIAAVGRARRPFLKYLTPLQRPLRIEQSWGLYGSGVSRVRRMEVFLDGALVYRTEDDEHDWMEPVFRNRRLRPMVDTVSRKPNARNRDGLMWLIAERAVSARPETSEIEVRFTVARFPGTDPRTAHAFRMVPPEWTPERL